MTKRLALPAPSGQRVPDALCPACGRLLRYHAGRRLACPGCPWAVTLSPAEHQDLAWYLAAPGIHDTPIAAFIAQLAQRVTLVPARPEPTLIGLHDGGFKWRVVPAGPETFAERADRLSE